jgi:hypothetical protein
LLSVLRLPTADLGPFSIVNAFLSGPIIVLVRFFKPKVLFELRRTGFAIRPWKYEVTTAALYWTMSSIKVFPRFLSAYFSDDGVFQ